MALVNGNTTDREFPISIPDTISPQQTQVYGQILPRNLDANEPSHTSNMETEAAKNFWRAHLKDAPVTPFPLRLPPKEKQAVIHYMNHDISPIQCGDFTSKTVVHAAWTLLLGLHLDSTDIVTGLTLKERTTVLPQADNIAEPTIAIIPFRTQFTKDEPLTKFLDSINKQYLDMSPFQHFGIDNIRTLNNNVSSACNFKSLLSIRPAAGDITNGITRQMDHAISSLDFALTIESQLHPDEGISIQATFDENLLPRQQVQVLLEQFGGLIRRIATAAEDKSVRVSDMQVICDAELIQVMKWNSDGVAPKSTDACVHDLVEKRTKIQPAALAVHAWDGDLSYETLDRYSSRLATHLATDYGVRPESLVPVCFEKSLWYVVSILAVMKAGGAYVPMDPKHPLARMRTIIEDLGNDNANLILTSSLHYESLSVIGTRFLAVGPTLLESLASKEDPKLSGKAKPQNSCVVVFTSGSTGKPKGIVIEHRMLSSSLIEHGAFVRLGVHTRALQFSAHTFDISMGDIFATLVYGGCICIPSDHERMNNLAGSMEAMNVNHANLTPTVASQLVPGETPSLKIVVNVGESMQRSVIEKWADRVTLFDMYGPAEATIFCIGKGDFQRTTEPRNIGQGVGALVWLTDSLDHNKLVPIGSIGEILVEGPTVTRGYLDNEEKTRAAFIENPEWATALGLALPRRLYKTGDLGYYNPDGSIFIVGRNDGQIKLNGHRIEIGEVEHQLKKALLNSADGAVSIVTPVGGRAILTAFVAAGPERHKRTNLEIVRSRAGLRDFRAALDGVEERMREVLPSYMVPETFIPISMLPLSASAKVERKRLQAIASELSSEELFRLRKSPPIRHHIARSLTPVEQVLQALWQEILQRSNIGLEDNFFGLGGDSVTAMRLGALARKRGIDITVERIFNKPVFVDQASAVQVR